MFQDAADLLLEGWYWMPYGLVLDLCLYQLLVRWLDSRSFSSPSRPPE